MRRVYAIYVLRRVINRFTLKCSALAVFAVGVVSAVSISNVFANMPSILDMPAVLYFSKYAFMNTELTVQFLIIGTAATVLWLLKDITTYTLGRNLAPGRALVH